MYISNTRRLSAALMSASVFSTLLFLFAFGCGKGPYEQCLSQRDCPVAQSCLNNQCVAPQQERPTTNNEPKQTPDASAKTEPTIPERTPSEPTLPEDKPKEPTPQCRSAQDCDVDELCEQGKCVKQPVQSACATTKFLGALTHPFKPGSTLKAAVSPDSKNLATFSSQQFHVYNIATGNTIFVAQYGSYNTANSVRWSPDGKYVMTSHGNNVKNFVLIWDVQNKKMKYEWNGYNAAFMSDNKTLAIQTQKDILFRDLATEKDIKKVSFTTPNFSTSTLFPSGKYVLQRSVTDLVTVWDTQTGKKYKEFSISSKNSYNTLTKILSDDLVVIAIGETSGFYTGVVSISQEKVILKIDRRQVNAIALAPNGHDLVYDEETGGTLIRRDLRDVSVKTTFDLKLGTQSRVQRLSFAPDGNHIITYTYNFSSKTYYLQSRNTTDYALVQGMYTPGQSDFQVSFNTDGSELLTFSGDGYFAYWDLPAIEKSSYFKVKRIAMHPQKESYSTINKALVNKSWDFTVTHERSLATLWDSAQNPVKLLSDTTTGTKSMMFSPKGDRIVGLFGGKELYMWDTTGKEIAKQTMSPGDSKNALIGIDGDTGKVITSQYDGPGHTLEFRDPETLMVVHKHSTPYAAWSFATSEKGGWVALVTREKTLLIFDARTGKVVHTFSTTFGNGRATFSPSGKYVALTIASKALIFNLKTGQAGPLLEGSTQALAFSPDDTHVAIAAAGGDVTLWNIQTGKQVSTLVNKGGSSTVKDIKFGPKGHFLTYSLRSSGTAQLWSCVK